MKTKQPSMFARVMRWLGGERRSTTAYGTQNSGRDFWGLLTGGARSKAGATVTEDSTLAIPTFWCGFNVICDSFQSMPLELYRRAADGDRERAAKDPRYKMMKTKPNREMNPGVFKRLACGRMMVPGQFFAEIERAGGGRPLSLNPIHPSRVEMFRKKDNSIWYKVRNNDNTHVEIADEDMFRPFRYTLDGVSGVSVIDKLKESFGLTIAANEYGAKFFGGNAMPSTLITMQGNVDQEHLTAFKSKWMTEFQAENGSNMMVVDGTDIGEVKDLTHSNEVSQFLETRQLQSVEVARAFPINPIKVFDMGKATWGNFTEVQDDYIGTSVMPFCTAFEEECDRKLLTERERETMYFEFNIDGALRAQIKARFEAFVKMFTNGMTNLDEIRAMLNMNKLPDGLGQDFYIPANLVKVGEKPEPTAPPTPPPAEDSPSEPPPADPKPARMARMDGPYRSLFAETGRRLARIEADRAGRQIKRPDEYPKWMETFATEHRERVRKDFTPLIVAYRESLDDPADVAMVDACIDQYMGDLTTALRTADPEAIAARDFDWILTRLRPQEN